MICVRGWKSISILIMLCHDLLIHSWLLIIIFSCIFKSGQSAKITPYYSNFAGYSGVSIYAHVMFKAKHKRTTKNTKQETKRFSTTAVYRLRHSKTKKHCFAKHCFQDQTVFDLRRMFSLEHVRNSQSTIYLRSHGCVHGFQHEV